jgi:hypothetical protein
MLPPPTSLQYTYPKSKQGNTYYLKETELENRWFHKESSRYALAVCSGIATLLALMNGYRAALVVVPVAWVLSTSPAFVGPSMSIRGYTYLVVGFHVGSHSRHSPPNNHAELTIETGCGWCVHSDRYYHPESILSRKSL